MTALGPNRRELDRRGVRSRDGDSIGGRGRTPGMDAGRSDLADRLPSFLTLRGYFTAISVANPTIAAGNSAWYGLASINIPEDVGQELQFAGLKVALGSCDPDANGANTGAATKLSWGNDGGTGAAIIIGERLPCLPNAWTSGPIPEVPGVEQSGASLVSTGGVSPYIWTTTFPPGKWGATTNSRIVVTQAFVPFVKRLTRGTRLDIALVVRRASITGQTGSLCGYGSVEVFAGQTINLRTLDG